MGKRKKYEEEKFTFNYPEDGDDVWTKNLDSRDMEKRLKKIAKKEKKKAKKEKKNLEKAQEVDLNNQLVFAQAEAKLAGDDEESTPGPIAPDPIRQAFSWHEQRLSIRGLFPEGLKKGVSIQHKFDDDEVVTMKKAENGLIAHPEYGIRNWTKSQVENFKKAGYIMNGFLGEEGTFGYLAKSAGGVRKQAKYVKSVNPIFTQAEIEMLNRTTDKHGEKLMDPEELEKTRVEQFKRFIARKQEEIQLEAEQKEKDMKILAKRKSKIMENI